eukprot:30895_1
MEPRPQHNFNYPTQRRAKKNRKSKHKLKLTSMSERQLPALMDDTSSAMDTNHLTTASPILPHRVLTKRNSKKWAIDHFDQYEKELKQQIDALMETNDSSNCRKVAPFAKRKLKRRRHSSLSFQNSHEWSSNDMNTYEDELVKQFRVLATQINTMTRSRSYSCF